MTKKEEYELSNHVSKLRKAITHIVSKMADDSFNRNQFRIDFNNKFDDLNTKIRFINKKIKKLKCEEHEDKIHSIDKKVTSAITMIDSDRNNRGHNLNLISVLIGLCGFFVALLSINHEAIRKLLEIIFD